MADGKASPKARQALASIDWSAIDAMTDEDIARQVAENPDAARDLSDAPPEAIRVMHVGGRINVRAIRAKLDLTQVQFAERFGFSVGAVRDWEQGRKEPDTPSRVLLLLIDRDPAMVADAVRVAAA